MQRFRRGYSMNEEPVNGDGTKRDARALDDSRTKSIPQQLMLGLIYPAILGTIMYSALDALYAQLTFVLGALGTDLRLTADSDTVLKFLLLAVTLAFYVCDYLYIMFTRRYRGLFFVLDLVFLAGLYVTVQVLDLSNKNPQPLSPFRVGVIAFCYLGFMLLYYWWDWIDRPGESGREQKLYDKVLLWEKWSIGALVVWLIAHFILANAYQYSAAWFLLLIIGCITAFFGKYTLQKREFCKAAKENGSINHVAITGDVVARGQVP